MLLARRAHSHTAKDGYVTGYIDAVSEAILQGSKNRTARLTDGNKTY